MENHAVKRYSKFSYSLNPSAISCALYLVEILLPEQITAMRIQGFKYPTLLSSFCHENIQASGVLVSYASSSSKILLTHHAAQLICFLVILSNLATFSIYSGNGINTTSPWLLVTSLPHLCRFLFILGLNTVILS